MYNPTPQKYLISQFNNNNLFIFMDQQVTQYFTSNEKFIQNIKLDQKQQQLELKVIEALLSDDKKANQSAWLTEQDEFRRKKKQPDTHRQKQQSNKQLVNNAISKESQLALKKQNNKNKNKKFSSFSAINQNNGNFTTKYIKNSQTKQYLKLFSNFNKSAQLKTNTNLGFQDKAGLLKFQTVMASIIEHCDTYNQTKNIHKVLYLVFKYFQLRIKYKKIGGNMKSLYQNNREKNQISKYKINKDLFQWLNDASNLFSAQLQHPPLTGQLSSRRKQHPNRTFYRISTKKKQVTQQKNKKDQPIQDKIANKLKQSYIEIQKTNKYYRLIKLVQNYEIQKLLQNIEQLIVQVNRIFDDKQVQSAKNIMVNRIMEVSDLILRRFNLQKKSINMDDQKINNQKYYSILDKLLQIQNEPQVQFDTRKTKLIYQTYRQLTTILIYIISILFGNRKVITKYAGNNVYLFLRFYINFIHPIIPQQHQTDSEQFPITKCKQVVTKYLQDLHNIELTDLSQISLNFTHNYLLTLLSKPLLHPIAAPPNIYLSTHRILQQGFTIFQGYQFYAYLIATIMFNLGLVEKQLHGLDEEYETNMISGLLMASANNVTKQKTFHKQDILPKENNSIGFREKDFGLQYKASQFSSQEQSSSNFQINSIQGVKNNQAVNTILSQFKQKNLISRKLILSTISFYKNILHKQKLNKNNSLLYLQLTPNISLQQQNLALNQLIQNLLLSQIEYKIITNQEQIKQIYKLSQYVCRIGVEQYLMVWLRHSMRITVQETGLIFQQEQVGDDQKLVDQSNSFQNQDQNRVNSKKIFRKVDEYIIQLMIVQIKLSLYANQNIFRWTQYSDHPYYSTQTFNLLYYNNYLTLATLKQPFDYKLINKIQQLSGPKSQLAKLYPNAARQFYNCFQVFFIMDAIKPKAKLQKTQQKKIKDRHNNLKNQNKEKIIQLHNLLHRVDLMISILKRTDTLGCGEAIRVAWQLLEDYQATSNQIKKAVFQTEKEEHLLDLISDKLIILIGELKEYINMMEMEGFTNEELRKFKVALN